MDITQKSLAAPSLSSPIRYLCTLLRSPWIFSRLSSHSSFSLSVCQMLPSLKSSLWAFTGLAPRSLCVPCIEEPRTGPSTPDVSGEGSSSSPCWQHFSWCSPGCCWCSMPQGCIVDFSLVCPPGLSQPSCFPAGQPHVGMWSYSFPSAGLFIFLCGC